MHRLVAATALLVAFAGTTAVAQAALPKADYHYGAYDNGRHFASVDIKGRRTVSGISVKSSNKCVGPGSTAKAIPISRDGRFIANRSLTSSETGDKIPGVAHFRGKFTSSKDLVLRVRFTRGTCSSKEYRFELGGSEYEFEF